jgi:hypothetical protein
MFIPATRAANTVLAPFPPSTPEIAMNTTPLFAGMETLVKPFKFAATPYEYKVTPLRECPTPETLQLCDTPDKAAEYWKLHIVTHPHFNPECECLAVLLLNVRRRIKGHQLISIGTQDTLLVHSREVFRLAVTTAAYALILMHNLCVAAHKLCYVEHRFMWSRWAQAFIGRGFLVVLLPSDCT